MPGLAVPATVNDLIVLPITYLSTPAYPHQTLHYLYLRPHAPKLPSEDTPRQIFLANIPTDATEQHIKSLFAYQLGGARVSSVAFEDAKIGRGILKTSKNSKKRKREEEEPARKEIGRLPQTWDRQLHGSGSTAAATFVDKASADLALREAKKAVKTGTKIIWGQRVGDDVPPLGRARYLAHQKAKYPAAVLLQANIDTYMTAFAAAEAENARKLAKLRAEPDEDGFITVVRGGRNGPAREEATKAKHEELKQRAKDRVKDDFYRFQMRQRKKEEAQKLVAGFQEDQRRVDEIRRRKGKLRPE